ncbi:MAG TPA: MaoC/PaaZ C-terminal domain-containing protein [Candidatus Hydrogenedens sp.]|nr:MaoC/PaaZ C-terminal domain-containing protein [Candidatus Hydrogenedens sp.]
MANKLNSLFVGRKSRVFTVDISPREAMKYAAGIYETNPLFYDDRVHPLLVHPMYAVALTWKISSRFDEYWDTAGFPLDVLERQVHYLEELRWSQPLYAGETLQIQGEVKAIVPHLSGTLFWIDYTAKNRKDEIVFVEGLGALLRDIPCEDEGKGKELFFRNVKIDRQNEKTLWEENIVIQPMDPLIYDACSDIHFPIHTSWAFSQKVGLSAPVYQGTATLSQSVRKIFEHGFNPAQSRIEYLYARFSSFVYGGDVLTIRVFKDESNINNNKLCFEIKTPRNDYAIKNGVIIFGG